MLLPSQALTFASLRKTGYPPSKINGMAVSLALFPTPFKGIYYAPFPDERKSRQIRDPMKVLTSSIALYLKSDQFYYSCRTAEEWAGIEWHPSGVIHVVNTALSKRIDLEKRWARKKAKKTYYSKTSAYILSQYGKEIVFHRCADISGSRYRGTPSGRFATKRQIQIDKKRFRC